MMREQLGPPHLKLRILRVGTSFKYMLHLSVKRLSTQHCKQQSLHVGCYKYEQQYKLLNVQSMSY